MTKMLEVGAVTSPWVDYAMLGGENADKVL